MESNAKYTLVGSFVLGAFVLIFLGVLWLSNAGVGEEFKSYTIYFRNQSLSGLQMNSAVTMKGIKVGIVDKLEIAKKNIELVQVIVKLEASAPVKIDTQATISRNLLTGLAFIELVGSHQESPELSLVREGERYPVIPEGKTSLDAVASSLPELMREATEVLGQISALLKQDNIDSISNTLKNAETITGTIANNSQNIDQLISKTTSLVTELEYMSKQLASITRPGDGELAKLNHSLAEGVTELRTQLSILVEKSTKASTEFGNSVRVVTQDVNNASSAIVSAARTFSLTAERLGELRSLLGGPDEKALGPGERLRPGEKGGEQ
jgi:phospholipid/cholesterol/gamma-HCH transport system substrate-binding protein